MHQPIFNVEADYAGMKQNTILMGKLKAAHIHLYLVSHFHNAQFSVSMFENEALKYKHQPVSGFNPKSWANNRQAAFDTTVSPDVYTNISDPVFDFKEKKPITLSTDGKVAAIKFGHLNRSKVLLKRNADEAKDKKNLIEISPNNEEYIVQVLTGHSGRELDTLYNDGFSDMVEIFGKASRKNGNGYTKARFYDNSGVNCAEITYYILKDDDDKTMEKPFNIHVCQKPDNKGDDRAKTVAALNEANFKGTAFIDALKSRVDPNNSLVKSLRRRRMKK